ncbi:unnamed protein product [Camellia sinensis]
MIVRYPHVHFDQFCRSSVGSEEFEPEALVDSGVAHRQDNSEVKTGLEEAHRGWFNSGVDSLDLGLRQPWLEGEEYLSIVDEFMEFEDFQMKWAFERL